MGQRTMVRARHGNYVLPGEDVGTGAALDAYGDGQRSNCRPTLP